MSGENSDNASFSGERRSSHVKLSKTAAIGIDLGSLNVTVAIIDQAGGPTIIDTRQGGTKLPAFVAHLNTEVFIGEDAQASVLTEPDHVLFCMKRFLGISSSESNELIQRYRFPFAITAEENYVCFFGAHKIDARKALRILLKETAATIREKLQVEGPILFPVWITIPDALHTENEPANTDVWSLAENTRILFSRLIPETRAACRGSLSHIKGDTVLVIHIGAAFSGAALYKIVGKDVQKMPLKTLEQIVCGNDFDRRIVREFATIMGKEVEAMDKQTYEILRKHAQEAKVKLSANKTASVYINDLADQQPAHRFTFTRSTFELICSDLFDHFREGLRLIHNNLQDFSDIALVGSSARIPKIQDIVVDILGKRPNAAVLGYADIVAAEGAALYAHEYDLEQPYPSYRPVDARTDTEPVQKLEQNKSLEDKGRIQESDNPVAIRNESISAEKSEYNDPESKNQIDCSYENRISSPNTDQITQKTTMDMHHDLGDFTTGISVGLNTYGNATGAEMICLRDSEKKIHDSDGPSCVAAKEVAVTGGVHSENTLEANVPELCEEGHDDAADTNATFSSAIEITAL